MRIVFIFFVFLGHQGLWAFEDKRPQTANSLIKPIQKKLCQESLTENKDQLPTSSRNEALAELMRDVRELWWIIEEVTDRAHQKSELKKEQIDQATESIEFLQEMFKEFNLRAEGELAPIKFVEASERERPLFIKRYRAANTFMIKQLGELKSLIVEEEYESAYNKVQDINSLAQKAHRDF